MSLKERLSQAWAKSDGTTIREHTDQLLRNLELLKSLYGEKIERACPERFRDYLWKAIELACEYHDYGKLHCKFQREVVRNKKYPDHRVEKVKHSLLSPAFMEGVEEEWLRDLVALAIIHHHQVETGKDVAKKVESVLKQEFGIDMESWHKRLLRRNEYEGVIHISEEYKEKYNLEEKDLKLFYRLIKGLLLRIDHASSNKEIERIEMDSVVNVTETIKQKKGFELNDLQRYVFENRDKCLMISAPTGYGKTEAGFIYLEGKGFFTIPVRTSANAIYQRAKELFEDKAGLIHSTALSFLMDDERERNELVGILADYEYARNFAKPMIVCTPDQLFPFVFAYSGFEKNLAILSYSAVVIDELQLFEPHTLGFLVEGIKLAKDIGSRIMVMTATLPEFVKNELLQMGFEEKVFDYCRIRHNLKVLRESIISDEALSLMSKKAQEGKVLVVTNTVKRAVELYTLLKGKGMEKVFLLHSRFILKDRKEKEKWIKEFFDKEENGLWVTTQLVEVSLDLDADFLFTEYSTPDSLFQRMGRVNRKGTKQTEEPNVFVFIEDCSGIGPVYRKSIHDSTKSELKDGPWTEEEKRELIRKVYSWESLIKIDEKYIESYKNARNYIQNLWEALGYVSGEDRQRAQELFRDIHSITVIPERFKKELEPYLNTFAESQDKIEKIKALNHILEYTFSIPSFVVAKEVPVERVHDLKGFNIYWLKAPYDEEKGLFELSKDPELLQDNVL